MGAAVAPGHAGLRGGLRLHRFPAVQRAFAGGPARGLWLAGPGVSRGAQHRRCHLGVHFLALPLCLPASAHRAGRARRAAHGGGAAAGRAAVAPGAGSGAAAGTPGRGGRRGAGSHGNPGRLWRGQLLRHPDLHRRHLQSLAGHGQPHRRCPARHALAGHRGAAAVAGAPGAKALAVCHPARPARRQCRCAARAAHRAARCAGRAGVWPAHPPGFCAAGAVHAAPLGWRLGRAALGHVCAMGTQQRLARRRERLARHRAGAGAGVCPAHPPRRAHTRRGAAHQPGLCRAWRGDCGGAVVAGGLGAAGVPRFHAGLLDHRHGAGHCVGVSGAVHGGGAAIVAKRIQPFAREPGRVGPHAGHHRRCAGLACALAAAAPQHFCRRLAGVCGCDEGAARHFGAAPLQQRHSGRGDLPARARRAPGRSRLARPHAGAGRTAAGDSAQPHATGALAASGLVPGLVARPCRAPQRQHSAPFKRFRRFSAPSSSGTPIILMCPQVISTASAGTESPALDCPKTGPLNALKALP